MEANDWDEVWLLEGAAVPFVLRRVDGDGSDGSDQYKLVGACYVHGVERDTDWCTYCSQNRPREPMVFSTNAQMRQRTAVWREFDTNRGYHKQQLRFGKRLISLEKRKRERQLEQERIQMEWQQDLQKQWKRVQQFGQ